MLPCESYIYRTSITQFNTSDLGNVLKILRISPKNGVFSVLNKSKIADFTSAQIKNSFCSSVSIFGFSCKILKNLPIFFHNEKLRSSRGETIQTNYCRKGESAQIEIFFSYFPVNMHLKSKARELLNFYPNSRENRIKVKGDTAVIH